MSDRWRIEGNGILWDVANDENLPHQDHVEMSGRHVSVIVRYGVDENRRLILSREVIWPMLRTREGDVRGYLKRIYPGAPTLTLNGFAWEIGAIERIFFDGALVFDCAPVNGVAAQLVVSVDDDGAELYFALTADAQASLKITVPPESGETTQSVYGTVQIRQDWELAQADPEDAAYLTQWISAAPITANQALQRRPDAGLRRPLWIETLREEALILETPSEILNAMFAFAKLRAAESLFETKMGLVHSPGGGRYYGGIWNNDQCEYSGPLFGYLGDAEAKRAALTAYRNFTPYMTPEFAPIPTSLEMEGTIPIHAGGDRGDAAMYAGGAARFALTCGDRAIAEELYPAIAWCLEYCRRKTNADGVVESDTDELEGRFPTGTANLSTSCLTFDAYRHAAALARSLNKLEDAADYDIRADALTGDIERYFGATLETFDTYRYYDGNTVLRAWICLPLCFGIAPASRIPGTIAALFSPRLWTPDGLATEAGDTIFWDRSTLYALRGVFRAGATETGREYLETYSRRRLLGDHVPYAVEAYPEGGQAHLSAESALYCRIFTEGMFGLEPAGLRSFRLTPRLPETWPQMALLNVDAFGRRFDIRAEREAAGRIQVMIEDESGQILFQETAASGAAFFVEFDG